MAKAWKGSIRPLAGNRRARNCSSDGASDNKDD